jgi:hypothetical protein
VRRVIRRRDETCGCVSHGVGARAGGYAVNVAFVFGSGDRVGHGGADGACARAGGVRAGQGADVTRLGAAGYRV